MTYQSKYRENNHFIKRYMDFLPEVDNYDDRLKLIVEIARLQEQNKAIDKMTYEESKRPIHQYTLKTTALL